MWFVTCENEWTCLQYNLRKMTQFSQLVLIWLYINPEDMNYKCFLVFTIFSCVYGKLPMENSESSLIIECSESKPDVIFKDRTIYPLPVSWKYIFKD